MARNLHPNVLAPAGAVLRKRRRTALVVAAAADLAQIVFFPAFAEGVASPPEVALDVVTAVVLALVLGVRPRLVLALVAELVPGLALFPSWTAVVLSLPVAPEPIVPGRALPSRDAG